MQLHPSPVDPLDNNAGSLSSLVMAVLRNKHRAPGPQRLADLHSSSIERWRAPADAFPKTWWSRIFGRGRYRPKTLSGVANALDALPVVHQQVPAAQTQTVRTGYPPQVGAYYTVVRGDTLRSLALKAYNTVDGWQDIFNANERVLGGNRDRIYEGQVLFIPSRSPKPVSAPVPAVPEN